MNDTIKQPHLKGVNIKRILWAFIIFMMFFSIQVPSASSHITGMSFSSAASEFQNDLNNVLNGLKRFDSNSAQARSIQTITQAQTNVQNNGRILREIGLSVSSLRSNLNKNKRFFPTRETRESPAFSVLINLANGYDTWLRYQNVNHNILLNCFEQSNSKINKYKKCLVNKVSLTLSNEALGREKLVPAVNAFTSWQRRFSSR